MTNRIGNQVEEKIPSRVRRIRILAFAHRIPKEAGGNKMCKQEVRMSNYVLACEQAATRLATIGGWPVWFDACESLVARIPCGDAKAPGFDAGIACALDLIPRDKQWLAATLHAAYTQAAVERVRGETADLNAVCQSGWWLAACSVCREGEVDRTCFLVQIEQFRRLAGDPVLRAEAARAELDKMKTLFTIVDSAPFVVQDGGLQGAYILGHDWGIQYAPAYGIFFLGTFRQSLGLENFVFSDRVDSAGRPMSGPVHGSRQFVKVSTFDELARALAIVRQTLA